MIRLDLTDAPTEAERAAVLDGLRAFNAGFMGPAGAEDARPLGILARGADGAVLGGVIGRSWASWLSIELVHVATSARGGGLGRRLLLAAEEEARARGCIGIRLDTFSFQAPGFYARLGYREIGRLADSPPGHTRIYLFKRLDGA